jgi:hypothetical protein
VAAGALQRRSAGGRVETLTYGEEGLQWEARQLEARALSLQRELDSHPSPKLAGILQRLDDEIARMNRSLGTRSTEFMAGSETLSACNPILAAHAAADPQTGSQAPGVAANADASFHNDCAELGNTYAYAYARARTGTVTVTRITEDPKYGGTLLDSAAHESAGGSLDCYSEAYARAWSEDLALSYEVSDTNYLCTNPLAVTINGPAHLPYNFSCQSIGWTASASGGAPPYTYDWYVETYFQTTGSSYTRKFCGNAPIHLKVTAHDSAGQSADGFFTTDFESQCDPTFCDPPTIGDE